MRKTIHDGRHRDEGKGKKRFHDGRQDEQEEGGENDPWWPPIGAKSFQRKDNSLVFVDVWCESDASVKCLCSLVVFIIQDPRDVKFTAVFV